MSDFKLVKIIDPTAIVTGGLVPKGAYNAGTAYSTGDSVSYNGSSYVAISSTTGNVPTNTTYWQLIAQGGTGGGGGSGGTVTTVSVTTANGVSGTVTNPTSTPAISLSLGAVTPTSVVATGIVTGSNLSGTNTGDQTTITGNAGTATTLQTARTIGTLTGDATSAGSTFDGSANNTNTLVLSTVNSNVGTFGSASSVNVQTVNGKGLTTTASSVPIQITESQVTSLTIDLDLKAPLASPALTGTPTTTTATAGTSTTQIASTAFVASAITTNDAADVHLAGAETITGVKTFSAAPIISTITNTGTITLPTTTDTLVGRATADTLSNKRITRRVITLTVSGSTYTPSGDTTDTVLIASPTANFTIANPTGTPTEGQTLIIRITSGTTAYTPSFGTAYSAGASTLPTSFAASSVVNLGFIYNIALAKWVLEASDQPQTMYYPSKVRAMSTKTSNYTITATDGTIRVDTTSGNISITLPTAGTNSGQEWTIKKVIAANTVTVVGTIDGIANYTMVSQYKYVTVQDNGTSYDITGNN